MDIPVDYVNRRVDRYLRDVFGILQSKICVLSKQKRILVNGELVKFDYRFKKGDKLDILDDSVLNTIRMQDEDNVNYDNKQKRNNIKNNSNMKNEITFGCSRSNTNKSTLHRRRALPAEMVYKLKQSIIYEDDNVLAINKPYGVSVQGGTGVRYNLEDYFQILCDKKLRIVHRIDKDTSGLLLLAKNVDTAVKLTDMFRKREVHKRYLAILSGIPIKTHGTIKTYIFQSKKNNIAYNARTTEERFSGKEAITKYDVIRVNEEKSLALVEFFPLTGRKHQIRLHAQHIKCPIVGDEKYGFDKKRRKLQLFAVAIDASPVVKLELREEDFPMMVRV